MPKRIKDAVDEPETLVDRLRGIYKNGSGDYPDASPPYKTAPIQHEAAREIERLRGERDALGNAIAQASIKAEIIDGYQPLTGPHLVMLCDDLATIAQTKNPPKRVD